MRWTPHALIEGCAIAAYAIGGGALLHLHPGRVHRAVGRHVGRGRGGVRRRRAGRQRVRQRQADRHGAAPRRRRLHLRRRDRDDELDRGEARQPAHQAAVPGGGGRLRHADHDQQRRDPGRGPAHHQPRRGVVQGALPGQPQEHRHQADLGLRPRPAARELRGHHGHAAEGDPLRHGGRAAARPHAQGHHPGRLARCRS